jgi:hypothetical protein
MTKQVTLEMAVSQTNKILDKIDNSSFQENRQTPIVQALIQAMTARVFSLLHEKSEILQKYKYYGNEHWIFTHGMYFKGRKLPKKYKMGIPQQCFFNSWRGAIKHHLTYFEGYTLYILPILHAWNLDPANKIVDLTLPAIPRLPFEDREYFGVPFKLSYVSLTANAKGAYGSLIDDWENNYPLLINDKLLNKAKEKL